MDKRFLLDMVGLLHEATDVREVQVVQLPTSSRSQSNVRLMNSQYVEADGLVYGILQCVCASYLGADVRCADVKGLPLLLLWGVASTTLMRAGVPLLGTSFLLAEQIVVPAAAAPTGRSQNQ